MNPLILLAGAGLALVLASGSKKSASASGSGGAPAGANPCDVLRQAYDQGMRQYAAAIPAMQVQSAEQAVAIMAKSVEAMREMNCPNPPPDPRPSA